MPSDIINEDAHTALSDVETTYKVLIALLNCVRS